MIDKTISVKYDEGKLKYSLLVEGMPLALEKVVRVLEYGARKYKPNGWKDIDNSIERYKEALYRHVLNLDGGLFAKDNESGFEHLAHIVCNAMFLMEILEQQNCESELCQKE